MTTMLPPVAIAPLPHIHSELSSIGQPNPFEVPMKTCAPFAFSLLLTLTSFGSLAAESAPAENITRQEYQDPNTKTSAPYLLYTPIAVPEP